MDMEEKLQWLDENYLSTYDRIEIDSAIQLQPAFAERVDTVKTYSAGSTESEVDNSFLTYNAVIGTSLDKELEHFVPNFVIRTAERSGSGIETGFAG